MRRPNLMFSSRPQAAARRWVKFALRAAAWLAAGAALTLPAQNHSQPPPVPMFQPPDQADNSFQDSPVLPAELRRVAVLPLAVDGSPADLSAGGETFGPLLLAELMRTQKFEVIALSQEDLRRQTGRLAWSGAEILPADFLGSLRRVYGCDAVLFCQLTTYRAYAPLAVGWRMKLVDTQTGRILWAVDQVFDAGQPAVLGQAHLYHGGGQWVFQDSESNWQVGNSPRLFGQYALAQSLSTLPSRKDRAKVSPPVADEPRGRHPDKNHRPK